MTFMRLRTALDSAGMPAAMCAESRSRFNLLSAVFKISGTLISQVAVLLQGLPMMRLAQPAEMD